ncbi:thiol reductant ABC exporter subunit CydC [Halomonas denitrificans]|nr:thiol reductant ABC exporter subunit CydC [Halomonas denitrificans]
MSALRRIARSAGRVRGRIVLAAALAVLGTGFAAALLAISGWLITAAGLVGLSMIPMIDIFAPGAAIRAAAVGRTVTRYGERLAGHDAMLRHLSALRRRAFRRLMTRPVRWLGAVAEGDLLTRLTRDIDTLELLVPRWLLPGVAALGGFAIAICATLLLAPELLPIVIVLPLATVPVLSLLQRAGAAPGRRIVRDNARMRADLTSWVDGLAELVSVGRAAERAECVVNRAVLQVRAQHRQRRLEALGQASTSALGYVAFWAVLIGGLLMVDAGRLTGPAAAGLSLLMLGLVEALQALPGGWILRANCEAAARRIEQLGGAPPADARRRSTHGAPGSSGAGRSPAPRLELDDVGFRWSRVQAPVLDGLDLSLAPRERVVIGGDSGCGKSTLGRIIAGELDPGRGSVRIDGADAFAIDEAVRLARSGILEQAPTLFSDTLEANLRLGDPEASTARLDAVLDAVDLAGWARDLPRGLSTWLGERGAGLSGGQARRLALARLLLTRRGLLVLDEPFAGLDEATASRVAEGIEPWLADRTVVVLSHDAAGSLRPDRELVLERGRLVAGGAA